MAMDKIQVQTPKGRCEKLQSVDPARRGRSNVSLIYLLQRPRVSPNSVRGALVKLSTKKNRFPHTFSKARALECNYSVHVTRPCPASSASLAEPHPRARTREGLVASLCCTAGMHYVMQGYITE